MFYIWDFLSCNSTYNKYIQTKQILFFLKQNKWVHFYDFLPSNKIHSNSNFTLNRNSKWFNIFAILHDWLCFFFWTLIFWFYFFFFPSPHSGSWFQFIYLFTYQMPISLPGSFIYFLQNKKNWLNITKTWHDIGWSPKLIKIKIRISRIRIRIKIIITLSCLPKYMVLSENLLIKLILNNHCKGRQYNIYGHCKYLCIYIY